MTFRHVLYTGYTRLNGIPHDLGLYTYSDHALIECPITYLHFEIYLPVLIQI